MNGDPAVFICGPSVRADDAPSRHNIIYPDCTWLNCGRRSTWLRLPIDSRAKWSCNGSDIRRRVTHHQSIQSSRTGGIQNALRDNISTNAETLESAQTCRTDMRFQGVMLHIEMEIRIDLDNAVLFKESPVFYLVAAHLIIIVRRPYVGNETAHCEL